MTASAKGDKASTDSTGWGVYDKDGKAVALADSVASLDYRNENRQANHPVQKGAFATYNKVKTPWLQRVRMVKGGSLEERKAFVAALQKALDSVDLYSVVTPEATYVNASVVGLDYGRAPGQGANMMVCDITLQEVRIVSAATYASTKTPAGARTVNGGTVQGAAPTAQQAASASNAR